jgi:hypothetical protein
MKRRTVGVAGPNASGALQLAALETKVLSGFPTVISHLTTVRYEDGEPRQPGIILLASQGAAYVLTAKDPDSCAQLRCVGQNFDDALALLELLLGAEDAPWEIDRWAMDRARKGRKNS